MSLLQHVGTARQVRDPRLRVLGPGVVAIEPETVWPEREARRHVGHGLVRGFMNLEAIHAQRKFKVGDFL